MQGTSLKWTYLAVALVGPAAFATWSSPTMQATALVGAALACTAVGFAWLAAAWATFPREDAHYTPFGKVSAFRAIVRFVIPLYDVYWSFAAHTILCDALNDALERREMPVRASAVPAWVATILMLAPLVALVFRAELATCAILVWVDQALWLAYMMQADRARRFVVLSLRAEREALAAKRRR